MNEVQKFGGIPKGSGGEPVAVDRRSPASQKLHSTSCYEKNVWCASSLRCRDSEKKREKRNGEVAARHRAINLPLFASLLEWYKYQLCRSTS